VTTGRPPDPDHPTSAHPAEVASFRAARAAVLGRIADAARRAGRDPAVVRLVAVSKTVPPERVRLAVAAGLTSLGENRVQEAELKRAAVPGAIWHLIGPLQSNKARRAVLACDVIESVDSLELARRLARLASEIGGEGAGQAVRLPVLFQVNVDRDPAKAGFTPDRLAAELPELLELGRLEPAGLMTIGRLVGGPTEARPTFAALRELSERLRADDSRLGPALSMGMSDDFEVAVEEGATIVRVGRALFGDRPHDGDGSPHHHPGQGTGEP
jgi:PLP dependent protein